MADTTTVTLDIRRNKLVSRLKRKWPLLLLEVIMITFTAIYFIPIYSIIVMALKPTKEVIFTPLAFPKSFYIENFIKAWKVANFGAVYMNSIIISLCAVIFRIVFASMASFTIAKRKNKFNEFLYIFFLSGIMIPGYTILVPLLRLVKNLGLMNSKMGLIVIYIAGGMPFAVFILVGFIRGIANEVIEAAVIDGCSVYKIFWIVVFPLLKPVITTLFIIDFLAIWNDFLIPMLTISDGSKRTVTLAMYNFYGEYGARWEMTFAGYTLAVIPLIIMYLFLQKNIVNGIMVGAVKG